MLTLLTGIPSNVVGVKATGRVNKADYVEVLLPALDDLAKRTGGVSLLLELQTELNNYTIGAWIEDAKTGLKYFAKWRKVAIVSRNSSVIWFTNTFGNLVPGTYRGFSMDELEAAKKWVADDTR